VLPSSIKKESGTTGSAPEAELAMFVRREERSARLPRRTAKSPDAPSATHAASTTEATRSSETAAQDTHAAKLTARNQPKLLTNLASPSAKDASTLNADHAESPRAARNVRRARRALNAARHVHLASRDSTGPELLRSLATDPELDASLKAPRRQQNALSAGLSAREVA